MLDGDRLDLCMSQFYTQYDHRRRYRIEKSSEDTSVFVFNVAVALTARKSERVQRREFIVILSSLKTAIGTKTTR